MSDARTPAAEFSELWKNHVSKRPARKTAPPTGKVFEDCLFTTDLPSTLHVTVMDVNEEQNLKNVQLSSGNGSFWEHKDFQECGQQQLLPFKAAEAKTGFQSPQHSSCRYSGFNHGDSPGDVEVSQDIFWDPTSPTQANTGHRNTKVVEISDIVNRIAPKDGKPVGVKSPLLQWIGDGAIPCTPEIPKRVKKKSIRHSSVDLMKLAKQFDENMQQDRDTSEHLTAVNSDIHECASTSEAKPSDTSHQSNVKDLKCLLTSDQVEAELQALFDCSTQKVSGRLSQSSSASTCSQKTERQPVTSAEPQQSELKSTNKSGSVVHHTDEEDPHGFSAHNCVDFDDDWEDDDLINDPFVSVITQNFDEQHGTKPKIALQCNTKLSTAANLDSTNQVSEVYLKSNCSLLQEFCPKPKTSNRRTFKLEPNPSFQSKSASVKELTLSSFTLISPSKALLSNNKPATTKTRSLPQPEKITNIEGVKGVCTPEDSVKGISDSFWENGDDDALLYEMCDSMETISNSPPQHPHHNNCQQRQDAAVEGQQKITATLQVESAWSTDTGSSANRQSACTFVRSKSIPGTSSEAVNYQGWNIPMKGANSKSRMSHSLPGSRVSVGTFSQPGDSSGSFQQSSSVHLKSHTVRAGPPQNLHHTPFKRSVSESAVVGNKVFVTNQMTAKCSAAEIERKKQEALARRRLRMQNIPKS